MYGHDVTSKIVFFIGGILLIAVGLIPIIQSQMGALTFLPEDIIVYQISTIVLGAFLFLYAFKRRRFGYRNY